MARIPDEQIERLKSEVSLVQLIEGAGHVLKPQGRDLAMRCPFHESDDTPSFIVTPTKNVWHCFGCQQGGSVIDWVMKSRGVSFRHAVELLRSESPALTAPVTRAVRTASAAFVVPADADQAIADRALLAQVIDAYHATLKGSDAGRAYLAQRGLVHPDLIDTFKLGFANRTLGYLLPEKNRVQGGELRGALQRIGILRESGHEHFAGSLVIPVIDADGNVTEVYGRKVTPNLRAGTPLHLYLPGPHRGVFNAQGLVEQDEVILCESLIDALTFWCAGYRNVTASYGIEGFTEEHLAVFRANGVRRIKIAYDADAAGDLATDKLISRLLKAGFDIYRCRFPKGMDANAYALKVTPASKSLGVVIDHAEWLGGTGIPSVREQRAEIVSLPVTPNTGAASAEIQFIVAASTAVDSVIEIPSPSPELQSLAAASLVEVHDGEAVLNFGERRYRVRGLDKNLSYEVLKVNLMVTGAAGGLHVDTLDLYQARARAGFVKQAALELGVEETIIGRDLAQLLIALEQAQESLIRAALKPTAATTAEPLSIEAEAAALALLRDPALIERIASDVEAIGVVGEGSNALVAYLACVSRKLDRPLAILIQSTSAAGKSTLMDALLSLMPEAERVHYSAMTGQSLFYLGEGDLKHKILAIAEEEGVRQASYALKLLQSQGELTIASTGKDPTTGKLVTEEYRVEGPVMLFLTTTAIDIDEELLNRCLVLTINESREQTALIQSRQRQSRTLDGLMARVRSDDVHRLHRAAQSLIRPLAVVNPFADRLTFASDRVRMRRDHQKYLALIDAIALLHQYQRPVRTTGDGGGGPAIEYIEVIESDIALANRLAHEVLGRSLDELPPQTRRVLGAVSAFVEQRAATQAISRSLVRFTRRELREATSLGDTQLKLHLARLEDHEYLIVHRHGLRHVYELAFDGRSDDDARQMIGLIDLDVVQTAVTTSNRSGQTLDRSGSGRPLVGVRSGTGRSEETPRNASSGAALLPLVAAFDETPRSGSTRAKPSYRNGSNGSHTEALP